MSGRLASTETASHELHQMVLEGKSLKNVLAVGKSPLIYASSLYDEELGLNILINGIGIDINETEEYGYSALHFACDGCLVNLVKKLVEMGANLEFATMDIPIQFGSVEPGGKRPLHIAAMKGELEIVTILLNAKVDPLAYDTDGNTAFVLASLHQRWKVAKLLQSITKEKDYSREDLIKKDNQDRQAAKSRYALSKIPAETMQQNIVFDQVFSKEECDMMLKEVKKVGRDIGWGKDRHQAYRTTDIPSYQVESLHEWLTIRIQETLFPKIALNYPVDSRKLHFRDLFYVKYEASPGEQSALALHRDGSLLSFNILLSSTDCFEGGGTYFENLQKIIYIEQGQALVHSGKHIHGGAPTVKGERIILVGFLDLLQNVVN